ncbi:hypothetical protein D9M73_109130 [compost metagenome]
MILRARPITRREIAGPRIDPPVHCQPRDIAKRAVADQGTQRVEHPRALVIDVLARSAFIDLIHLFLGPHLARDDRAEVGDLVAFVGQHGRIARLTLAPAAVKRLHVRAIALVQPVIVPIGGGQLVAEIFMGKFVLEQPVKSFGGLGIVIAVGVDRLVLHALMRCLHHADFLVPERVRADFAFEEIERRGKFSEQRPGLVFLARQEPVEHRDAVAVAALIDARNLLIRPDIERDAIGIGVLDPPVPHRPPVGQRIHPEQLAIGGGLQPLGHGDMQRGDARFARREIEARPEQIAAIAFGSGGEPRRAAGRGRPHHAAVPRGLDRDMWLPAISDARGDMAAFGDALRQRDDEPPFRVAPRGGRERRAIDGNGIDRQIAVEVDREAVERGLGGEAERRHAAQRLGLGQHLERQVGGIETQFRLVGIDHTARPRGLRRDLGLAFLGQGGGTGQREAATSKSESGSDHEGSSSTEKSVMVMRRTGRPFCRIEVVRGKRIPCAVTVPANRRC